jgi:acyl-lipid omega-6 desaturase (Delta-12 desaturase)
MDHEHINLRRLVAGFQTPVGRVSLLQLATSFGGFFAVCAAMYALIDVSYWTTVVLAPLAAGFLVRIFIIQHDCGHSSFFESQRLNDAVGFACSLLTLAPYASWSRQHAGHHGVWNNLDRRQSGADIYSFCLTVVEYRALSPWSRRWYRLTRHPIVANVILPPLIFLVLYRLPFDMPKSWRRERAAVHLTNVTLVGVLGVLGLLLGFGRLAAVQIPVMVIASTVGVWLFSVQHRGESARWLRREEWSSTAAALDSSTFLRLPAVLQWFTGNIGFHHIHHLNPRVPNYRLEACHRAMADLHRIPTMSLRSGVHALRFVLWDEDRGRMATVADATI